MSTHQPEPLNVPPTKSLTQILNNLRQKLQGFAVFDQEGLEVGVVEDVILYENYPTLVVSFFLQAHQKTNPSLVWIRTNLVHKINTVERSLVVNTDLPLHSFTAPSSDQAAIARSDCPQVRNLQNTSPATTTSALPEATQTPADLSSAKPEEIDNQIRLLAERLILRQSKRKIGEVVMRKVVETEWLEIPLLQEKLVMENIPVEQLPPPDTNTTPASRGTIELQTPESPSVSEASNTVVEAELIRLLEERLVTDTHKTKVGNVVVRKVVETQKVKVPVRWEKLVVEQVSPEFERLLEIDLYQRTSSDNQHSEATHQESLIAEGQFNSLKAARSLIDAIALEPNHGCTQVQISITVSTSEQQQRYQQWFDRVTST